MGVRVAFQGEPGAYSEAAAHEAFAPTGQRVDAIGYPSFDDVFAALIGGEVEYAAVPVENTLGGSIHVNYDLMLRHHGAVHAIGEHLFRVRHTLLVLPGVKKADVKKAMSHPQALASLSSCSFPSALTSVVRQCSISIELDGSSDTRSTQHAPAPSPPSRCTPIFTPLAPTPLSWPSAVVSASCALGGGGSPLLSATVRLKQTASSGVSAESHPQQMIATKRLTST